MTDSIGCQHSLNFGTAANSTFSGIIQGSSLSLSKTGAGTFVLPGANNVANIAINQGTLVLAGASNVSSSIAINQSTLVLSGANNVSGSGIAVNQGTLVVASANNVSGIAISQGTLQLGTGGATGTLTSGGSIVDNGTLVVSHNNTMTQGVDFSSAGISDTSGTGSLVQLGPGNLVLNAVNTYGGPTAVSGGILTVNGSLAASSSVSVAGGATLAGSGSVGASTINAGGTVQGGFNNAGSLTLASLAFGGTAANTVGALGASNSSPAPIIVNNAVTTSGANTVNVILGGNPPAASGVYPYLQYGSLAGSGGASAFQFAQPTRALSLTSSGNVLETSATPPADIPSGPGRTVRLSLAATIGRVPSAGAANRLHVPGQRGLRRYRKPARRWSALTRA